MNYPFKKKQGKPINANFAKSDGWNDWLIIGIVNQRDASLMLEPNFQV